MGERWPGLRRARARDRRGPGAGALRIPPPPFGHLHRLTDSVGIFEHALVEAPRVEHGYCTDDVARALAVTARESSAVPSLVWTASTYIAFLERAMRPDGRFHNRAEHPSGAFVDEIGSDDANGRALFGLGCAARHLRWSLRERAFGCFELAAPAFASRSPRANAWAVLGGVELLSGDPKNGAARRLVERCADRLGELSFDVNWPWPEARLAYDNARLAEARIAAGIALDDDGLIGEGFYLLDWLVKIECREGWFSFTPVGGWASGEVRPGFDQQPIEAGSIAEACARAYDVTGDTHWSDLTVLAAKWFLGANDVGIALFDSSSEGCCDGLQSAARNENQGAESTLALISALQQANRVQAAARSARTSLSVSMWATPMHRSAAP